MMQAPVAFGPLTVLDEDDGRLRLEVVVYDEAAYRGKPIGLTPEALAKVAHGFVGLPVLDRRHEIEAEPGKEIGIVRESRLDGTRIVQVHEWWDPAAIRAVREGIRQGFSISWDRTSLTEFVEANGRRLYTDALPLEVIRTYAPVVHGTGVNTVLNRNREGVVAMAVDIAKIREGLEQLAGELGMSVADVLGALAQAEAGEPEPEMESEPEPEPEPETVMPAPAMRGAAEAEKLADAAVDLRMRKLEEAVATLSQRNQELEEQRERDAKMRAIRQFRRSGHLKGSPEQLAETLMDVSVTALSKVLEHTVPGEPIDPGSIYTDASAPAETGETVAMSAQEMADHCEAIAKKTGEDYEVVLRRETERFRPRRRNLAPEGGAR